MAGSGSTTVRYNTRERVLSTDHNREQALDAADHAEALARQMLSRYPGDTGVSELDDTQSAPMTALVIDGLMFRPIDGSTSALVDPGTVVMSDPEPSLDGPDDKPWKRINSDGVSAIGQLLLSPNPGGIRIDVVEFSRGDEVVEYDNRDIFNLSTGLFDPVAVAKVVRGILVFRIRQGIVGSSFPGVEPGWTPIAVVRVPAVATTWDVCTIWDVRPLLADRAGSGSGPRVEQTVPRLSRQLLRTDFATLVASSFATVRVTGYAEGELGGWRVGGALARSVPGTFAAYLEASEAASQEGSGVTFDADAHWYLYLLFPYGLPAWRRYSDPGAGGRVPAAHRGMAVFSKKPPRFTGRPSELIYPPNSTDVQNGAYATQSHPALCVAAGSTNDDATPKPRGIVADGRAIFSIFAAAQKPPSFQSSSQARFDLAAHADFPDMARAIWVRIAYEWVATGADSLFPLDCSLQVTDASGALVGGQRLIDGAVTVPIRSQSGQSFEGFFERRLPLEPSFDESGPRAFGVYWLFNPLPAGVTLGNVSISVYGWELGD